MSLDNSALINEFKIIFNPLDDNDNIRTEFLDQETYLDFISEELSKSIIEYMENIEDDDGDKPISIAGDTTLASVIRSMFEYDDNDLENINPLQMDLDWQAILVTTMLSGLTFGISNIDPAWSVKLTSTSLPNTEDFIWIEELINDGFEVWKTREYDDMAIDLANEVKRVSEATMIFITGLDKTSPTPLPISKTSPVQ